MIKLVTATWGSLTLHAAENDTGSNDAAHPNEMKFKGVLLQLDVASTKPPNGAKGHRILVPKVVAQKRIDTLLGMGVNLSVEKDGHAPQRKVGVIKKAWISGSELWVSGTIWKKDFPDAEEALKSKKLGMSFEGSDVQIEDQKAHIWKVQDLVFTGAALLLKTSAAYLKTEALAASAMLAELVGSQDGGAVMAKNDNSNTVALDPNVLKTALLEALGPLASAVQAQTAAITSMHASSETFQTDMIEMLASKSIESEDGVVEEVAPKVTAKSKVAATSHDDEDDEEDMDDEDMDEDDVEGKGVKAEAKIGSCSCGKSDCKDCNPGGKGVKAEEGDLDELGEDVPDIQTPGKMNKGAEEDKGDKTTTTKVAASARLRTLVTKLMAENASLKAEKKELTTKLKAQAVQVEAAADRISRKSAVVSKMSAAATNAMKPSQLFSGLLSKYDIAAEGEKKTMAEFNEILNAQGITDPTQRIALKSEAERNGTVYTAGESR